MTSSEIQELKDFMRAGFERVDGRLEGVQSEVAEVRGEVAEFRTEHREFQSHVAKHFGRVYERMDGMDHRLRRVELGQEKAAHDFKAAFEQVSDTNRRVDALDSKMERGFSGLREEMRFGFRTWGKRVEAVEARLGMNGGGEGEGA